MKSVVVVVTRTSLYLRAWVRHACCTMWLVQATRLFSSCFSYRALWYNYVMLDNKMQLLKLMFYLNYSCLLHVWNILCLPSGRSCCTCSLVWYVINAEITIKGYIKYVSILL